MKQRNLCFSERKGMIIYPKSTPNGKMILKTEYLDAFPDFDIAMLEKGYHLIFISHRTRWASDEEIDIMAEFVRFCSEKLATDKRCILEGMSCGGLQAARFAQKYPEHVSVMYLDAPVLNILSMAGLGECKSESIGMFWRDCSHIRSVDALLAYIPGVKMLACKHFSDSLRSLDVFHQRNHKFRVSPI